MDFLGDICPISSDPPQSPLGDKKRKSRFFLSVSMDISLEPVLRQDFNLKDFSGNSKYFFVFCLNFFFSESPKKSSFIFKPSLTLNRA